ncbi:hypothetical protein C9J03_25300 [Photobacterium gaetbulicola]|uniref:CS1 type fimbrial major subunit n=1 Tax=Photobacterium gaetbulicola Gung47 TaxID=658445 RepID=A0A0C4JN23_9GAMM|nr:CS1 type fimbrial major subunit [Photobacterium gaetbulicola]AHA59180.1 hypothetical protein H744_p0055 [Photobacterium gaetbulicola Gung47]PSU00006.1 hypothetical protein C9J03_25300 [Photobacterium gaetbulicola]
MFSKKTNIVASLTLAALVSSGTANADLGDKINKVINVSATIPSGTFSVEPVYGSWPTDIELPYDTTTQTFNPYQLRLNATTSVGLTAYLQQEAELVNGTTKIPLTVKLDDTVLGPIAAPIISNTDPEGPPETHVIDLSIEAVGPHDTVGLYAGVVNMVFEDNF